MAISESDVSIIIPTYNNAALAEKALLSALKTNAGEIIISDDNSSDNTFELLTKYSDKRIRISENEKNIGLWENHLRALKLAKLEWIKFLQQDDEIADGGLKDLCDQADEKTAIIGTLPFFINLDTGEKTIPQKLSIPKRWSSKDYLERLTRVGFELGNPSMTLIRKDAIEMDERAWRTDISSDYIMHVIVPTKGDVVIIPPGAIILHVHRMQDSYTANFSLSIKRMANTLIYFSNHLNKKIKLFASLVSFIETFGVLVSAIGQVRKKRKLYKGFFGDWLKIVKVINILAVLFNINKIITLFRTKYFGYTKNLDR